ncbi:hypothetical protein RSAG8_10799, partial [Rhizoctonia solani AG-8 WAC10335]
MWLRVKPVKTKCRIESNVEDSDNEPPLKLFVLTKSKPQFNPKPIRKSTEPKVPEHEDELKEDEGEVMEDEKPATTRRRWRRRRGLIIYQLSSIRRRDAVCEAN